MTYLSANAPTDFIIDSPLRKQDGDVNQHLQSKSRCFPPLVEAQIELVKLCKSKA